MNEELFKRLQDQCWIYHTHPDMIDTESNGEVRPCGFDTKKFAELIVRECVTLIRYMGNPTYINDSDWEVSRMDAMRVIQKHFGVQ